MFVGQYEHSLDRKGRVVLPAPFRASVVDRGVVTLLDQCIGLWSVEGFRTVGERWMKELGDGKISNRVFRGFTTNAHEVKLDAAGRITIPRNLLDKQGFESQTVIAGRFDRVEIWPLDKFRLDQDEEASDELADAINRLGL